MYETSISGAVHWTPFLPRFSFFTMLIHARFPSYFHNTMTLMIYLPLQQIQEEMKMELEHQNLDFDLFGSFKNEQRTSPEQPGESGLTQPGP